MTLVHALIPDNKPLGPPSMTSAELEVLYMISRDRIVLEFGAGYSTIAMSHAKALVTIEDDGPYWNQVRNLIHPDLVDNVTQLPMPDDDLEFFGFQSLRSQLESIISLGPMIAVVDANPRHWIMANLLMANVPVHEIYLHDYFGSVNIWRNLRALEEFYQSFRAVDHRSGTGYESLARMKPRFGARTSKNQERLREWLAWWRGKTDDDAGPRPGGARYGKDPVNFPDWWINS